MKTASIIPLEVGAQSGALRLTSQRSGTGLEPVTKQATVRYLYHSATVATTQESKDIPLSRSSGMIAQALDQCVSAIAYGMFIQSHSAAKRTYRSYHFKKDKRVAKQTLTLCRFNDGNSISVRATALARSEEEETVALVRVF
ncbi:hypothetical protein TNCV_3206621 [Trichonephila clavipes]|nr:hypothetical protein TNCV_3206621 [Trichonephila clavipes]